MWKRNLGFLSLGLALLLTSWLALAAPGSGDQPQQGPFRNPIEQREQMIQELREIKDLLKQQNDLLRQLQKG